MQNNFSIPQKLAKNVIVVFRGLELVTSQGVSVFPAKLAVTELSRLFGGFIQ